MKYAALALFVAGLALLRIAKRQKLDGVPAAVLGLGCLAAAGVAFLIAIWVAI